MKKILLITAIGILVVFGLICAIMYFSYNNQDADYRNRYVAQENAIENRLDNMWKIIADKFSMSEEYSEQFKEVARINVGAFTEGGEMWKWINTQLPQIDPSIYREVMVSIERERLAFEQTQNLMIDLVREHTNLITKRPSMWFVSNKTKLEWEVISSSESKEIMKTRQDERGLDQLRNE